MLSTAHFEDLCTECSFAKSRFLVRLYAEPVNVDFPLDKLPEYQATFTMSIDRRIGHAKGCHGNIKAKNVDDVERFLRSKGVLEWHWERHKNGKIKRVTRKIK